MTEICCAMFSDDEPSASGGDSNSRSARRRRMEIRRFRCVAAGVAPPPTKPDAALFKRQKIDAYLCRDATDVSQTENGTSMENEIYTSKLTISAYKGSCPKYGVASVCGRRRDMEDAVSIRPSFYKVEQETKSLTGLHYFGVYDGHGCSHVATKCSERLHELVKEELAESNREASTEWKGVMERSFSSMDKEAIACNETVPASNCRCELQMPECDAVGSAAVVAVVSSDQIIVANCGDSRAILSRNGKAIPLSSDHKPDRPDELKRIEKAGGRVIYWNGARVMGVLAMSRAIGDNYLKPYVSCKPEVMVLDRTAEDECLILGSDGLWDAVSNETAVEVARMCLKGREEPLLVPVAVEEGEGRDKACSDASVLLTKLALARQSSDNVSVVVVDLRNNM